jgi:uncharacterized protein YcbK (DUF882 family)
MGDLSLNFSRVEFACKCGCGLNSIDTETLAALEEMRSHFQVPVSILSAHRCPSHNKKVGGAINSQHLYARAVDIKVTDKTPKEVYDYLNQRYPSKYGLGLYRTFTHLDTRTNGPARWTG